MLVVSVSGVDIVVNNITGSYVIMIGNDCGI